MYEDSGVALIRSQNVGIGRFERQGLAFINEYRAGKLDNVSVEAGDILLNITGDSVARVARAPAWATPARVNQHVAIVRPRPEVFDTDFLFYHFLKPSTQAFMLAMSSGGGTRKALTKGMIEGFKVPRPPLPEQRAISRMLGALDDKIELNREMNRTLEATAQAVFRSWFVDFDPVVAKADGRMPFGMSDDLAALFPDRFVESELGPIPEGWKVQSLEGLTSKIGSGATPRGGKASYVEEGIALVRSQNVYDSDFQWDGLARITDAQAERLSGVTLEKSDILLNITGASILRTCVVDPEVLPARVNQHVAIVRAKPGIPSRFLHQHLLRPDTKSLLFGMNAGGSREAITKAHIESVQLVVPSEPLLDRFERTTDPVFAQKESNLAESRTLAELRDLLLPKLLSGEIRVGEAEEVAAAAGV